MVWQMFALALAAASPAQGQSYPPAASLTAPPCAGADLKGMSPAPPLADGNALLGVPFVATPLPARASYVVGLDANHRPLVRCFISYETSAAQAATFEPAVAGLVFNAPIVANTAAPGGRYLVQLYSNLGFAAVMPPPDPASVAPCTWLSGIGVAGKGIDFHHPGLDWAAGIKAPKPSYRKTPVYPFQAEASEIEGSVTVRLGVDETGRSAVSCISEATPPGWFEKSAVDAVTQWQFATAKPGYYVVTMKFRLE